MLRLVVAPSAGERGVAISRLTRCLDLWETRGQPTLEISNRLWFAIFSRRLVPCILLPRDGAGMHLVSHPLPVALDLAAYRRSGMRVNRTRFCPRLAFARRGLVTAHLM
jgi:hypothetical protein